MNRASALRAAGLRAPVTTGGAFVAACALALIGAAIAVKSLQAAVLFGILLLLLAVYGQSRRAGLIALWCVWLLTPVLRRLLSFEGGALAADPLSLLPFLATGGIALLELLHSQMSRRTRLTLGLAALGFLIGAPMGMAADPAAFGFAALAYLSALGAFAIGWGDAQEEGTPTLVRTLVVAVPLIAAYGILQYFLPLFSWDSNWVESVDLESIGSPQEGHIRIFATLNSPGTLGLMLMAAIVLGLGVRRKPVVSVLSTLVIVVALALTFVRSAWLALAVGVIVFVLSARGRSVGKLVGFIAVFLVAIFVVGGSNPTTQAFTERITTLGQLSEDDSANARLGATSEFLPAAVAHPLGEGLGQSGLSSTLDEGGEEDESRVATDNGYLAMVFEVGPAGFLLITFAMIRGVLAAMRALGGSREEERQMLAAVLAALVALVLANAGGNILYGITGAVFWYLAGFSMAGEEKTEKRASEGLDERPG